MKINFNMDRLLDLMMEADNATFDYNKSSKIYYKNHGYGVCLDHAKTEEEKHIVYAYHSQDKSNDIIWSILEVLDLDLDQRIRLSSAYRAVKRWYERETQWQRCLSAELIERITDFVIGSSH